MDPSHSLSSYSLFPFCVYLFYPLTAKLLQSTTIIHTHGFSRINGCPTVSPVPLFLAFITFFHGTRNRRRFPFFCSYIFMPLAGLGLWVAKDLTLETNMSYIRKLTISWIGIRRVVDLASLSQRSNASASTMDNELCPLCEFALKSERLNLEKGH